LQTENRKIEARMTGETKPLNQLKPFRPALYEGVNLNWLVLVSVQAVEDAKASLSFENIVVAAYRLFPDKFSLLSYPEHPDAKRVHDALWRCAYENRQWLIGKTSQGFAFTEKGRRELQKAREALAISNLPARKTFSQTRRFEKLMAEVREAPAFRKYLQKKETKVSEAECCHVLQGTLDSDKRILRDNLARLDEIARDLGQEDITKFLEWLRSRFACFLEGGGRHARVRGQS